MADTSTTVHIGENSTEEVAYKLLHDIARVERKALNANPSSSGWTAANRAWILDTYLECLSAVRGYARG